MDELFHPVDRPVSHQDLLELGPGFGCRVGWPVEHIVRPDPSSIQIIYEIMSRPQSVEY